MESSLGKRVVYRATLATHWTGDHPLLARRRHFQALGYFPAYRWNDSAQDALYTSHEPLVAWEEVARRHRPGGATSLAASDLEDTGDVVLLVLASFAVLPADPGRTYDGRTEGILNDPRIEELMAEEEDGGYEIARGFAAGLTQGAPWACRLVVPSAPLYRAGERRWNSVFYIADDYIREGYLPPRSAMREVFERADRIPALDTLDPPE